MKPYSGKYWIVRWLGDNSIYMNVLCQTHPEAESLKRQAQRDTADQYLVSRAKFKVERVSVREI